MVFQIKSMLLALQARLLFKGDTTLAEQVA